MLPSAGSQVPPSAHAFSSSLTCSMATKHTIIHMSDRAKRMAAAAQMNGLNATATPYKPQPFSNGTLHNATSLFAATPTSPDIVSPVVTHKSGRDVLQTLTPAEPAVVPEAVTLPTASATSAATPRQCQLLNISPPSGVKRLSKIVIADPSDGSRATDVASLILQSAVTSPSQTSSQIDGIAAETFSGKKRSRVAYGSPEPLSNPSQHGFTAALTAAATPQLCLDSRARGGAGDVDGFGDYDFYATQIANPDATTELSTLSASMTSSLPPATATATSSAAPSSRVESTAALSTITGSVDIDSEAIHVLQAFGPLVSRGGGDWKAVLKPRWPGREGIIDTLSIDLQGATTAGSNNVVLYGVPGAGKSQFVRELYAASGALHVLHSCVSGTTQREFHATLLHEVADSVCNWISSRVDFSVAMSSLCSRGKGGRNCAASLVRWASHARRQKLLELYHQAMNALYVSSSSAGASVPQIPAPRCGSILEFSEELEALTDIRLCDVTTTAVPGSDSGAAARDALVAVHIVLDEAEKLLTIDRALVNNLLRIMHKCPTHLSLMFVTSNPTVLSAAYAGLDVTPMEIHFPRAKPADIRAMLLKLAPPNATLGNYTSCVDMVMRTFGIMTGHDLRELVFLAHHFLQIAEKIAAREKLPSLTQSELIQYAKQEIDGMKTKLLQRESAVVTFKRLRKAGSSSGFSTTIEYKDRSTYLELPLFSRVLLMAAFCASRNPPSVDRRLFASGKPSGGNRSLNAQVLARVKQKAVVSGPKVFTLERVLALFYCLVKGNSLAEIPDIADGEVNAQIARLIALGMLGRVTEPNDTHITRYKCNIGEQAVVAIAKSFVPEIDIKKYLYDPLI